MTRTRNQPRKKTREERRHELGQMKNVQLMDFINEPEQFVEMNRKYVIDTILSREYPESVS